MQLRVLLSRFDRLRVHGRNTVNEQVRGGRGKGAKEGEGAL